MKRFIVLLILSACASHSLENDDLVGKFIKPISNKSSDAGAPDAAIVDASVNNDAGEYNYCVSVSSEPSAYDRLLAYYCTDSNGQMFLFYYWDTLLNIACEWKQTKDKVRCLPQNEQSSFFFADDTCSTSIAVVKMNKDNQPASPYVGLDIFTGGTIYIQNFQIGKEYLGEATYLNYQTADGKHQCLQTFLFFPGTKMFYVGSSVPPDTFVAQ